MRWLIVGANRETAEDVELAIEAMDEHAARAQASRRGVLVETCSIAGVHPPDKSLQPAAEDTASIRHGKRAVVAHRLGFREQRLQSPTSYMKSWRETSQQLADTAKAFVIRRPWVAGISGLTIAILLLAGIEMVRTAQADQAARAEQRVLDAAVASETAQLEREKAQLNAARQSMSESSPSSDTTTASNTGDSRHMTKGEAIDADPVISALLDQYPDLRGRIERGGTDLSIHLTLMVGSGLLSPSDTRYIERFSSQMQELPD